MFTISLHKVAVFAPAGLYAQEWVLGNHFEVDIDVQTEVSNVANGSFVDYTVLNSIIRSAFTNREETLERIAQNIHSAAFKAFPFVLKIKVSVSKLQPPMPGVMACARVVFEA
jgi:dihydroneopterin aldolase